MHITTSAGKIWKRSVNVDWLNQFSAGCMVSHIGIEFTEVGDDYITARMPVDDRTTQPTGLLHGGASVALAETLGSTAAYCCTDDSQFCAGIEINANHIRKATDGYVEGIARPVHIGTRTHVWETVITDSDGRLVCTSRMTLAILDKE